MDDSPLTTHRSLAAKGLTRADVRALMRDGQLEQVRRGVYRTTWPVEAGPEQRHRLLVRATWSELEDGAVVSHSSAAIMHRLPLLGAAPGRVWVTRTVGGHGRADSVLHLRRCSLHDDEIVELDGVRVTSLARTVADIARSASLDQGVVVADAGLRAGLSLEELTDSLQRVKRWPGIARARWVASFADGRSESPGESVSRVRMHQAGIPEPVLQWTVTDADGRDWTADFAWLDLRTVGEFDGKVKYGALVKPGRTPQDVIMAEKRRENRIRASGLWIVRWGWAELADPAVFGKLLRQGFANAPRAA